MPSLPVADNLLAARELMAFTLGFHIIIACVGVALPAMMLIAEYRGRRHGDEVALDLAKRWSKAAAVLFAVGAVTGTVISFEMGLLWPHFMERFGDVFGTGFAIEGIFFFTEAIFIAIYIYGWKRIQGWAHFWTGVPIVIAGIGGAFSVVAVNSWMNQPQGFQLDSAGNVTDVQPLKALFNPATVYEVPHMLLAAYMVVGFGLASVYAIGMLRNPAKRHDRRHRLGLLIPLTVAAILTPVQLFVGDTAARGVADHQPSKFAGFECIQETGPDQTEWIGGICTEDGVKYGIGIPGLDSFLVGFSTDTVVTGLDQIPDDEEPPANTMLHLAFDAMVGIGSALLVLGAWLGFAWWRKRDIPETKWFLRAVARQRRRRGRGPGGGLGRHRGRPPALDRLRGDADIRRGDRRRRALVRPRRRRAPLRRDRHRRGDRPAADRAARGAGRRRRRGRALRTAAPPTSEVGEERATR